MNSFHNTKVMGDTVTKKADWLKDISERRKYFFQKNLDRPGFPNSEEMINSEPRVPDECTEDKANLISSWLGGEQHAPAIDLDIPHTYRESKTPGHGHLLIDVDLSFEQYKKLLDVLLECGIIQEGFHHQINSLGATFLRTPKKRRLIEAEEGKRTLTPKEVKNLGYDQFKQLYMQKYAYNSTEPPNLYPQEFLTGSTEPSEDELIEIEEEDTTMCICGDPDCQYPVYDDPDVASPGPGPF